MQPCGTGEKVRVRLLLLKELIETGMCRRCNQNKFSNVRGLYEWMWESWVEGGVISFKMPCDLCA